MREALLLGVKLVVFLAVVVGGPACVRHTAQVKSPTPPSAEVVDHDSGDCIPDPADKCPEVPTAADIADGCPERPKP